MIGTIRARLLRLVALLLLPGLAISTLLTWQVYVTAREGAEIALREAAHSLAQLVDREFVQTESLLRTLAATAELQNGDTAAFDRLARATAVPGGAIVLTDAAGRELVNTALPPPSTTPPTPAPNASAAGQTLPNPPPETTAIWRNQPLDTPVILPMTATSQIIQVMLPIGVGGRHVYDLKAIFPLNALQSLLVQQRLPAGWVSSLIEPDGIVVAHARVPGRDVGGHASPALSVGLSEADEGTLDGPVVDGVPAVLAFSRAAHSGWAVAVASPRALIVEAGRQSTTLLAILSLSAILGGIFGARRVARSISGPIEGLAVSARMLGANGGWLPIRQGLAEADSVARAMQAASVMLADRQAALASLNAGLAARVEERARQLAAATTELDAQRRSLADILDEMPVGVLVHKPNHTLSFLNLEARRLLQMSADDTVEPSWPVMRQAGQLLDYDQIPTIRACSGCIIERAQISATCSNGQQRELEISASPLRDSDGNVTLAVTVFQDVTARLEAEEARRRSQRLEAVGQLTGGVAHEFNNLLLAVSGCLELLAGPVARLNDERAENLLANATRATGRGGRLTTQLLAFARRQTLMMEPLDLHTLVLGMRELLEGTLGRNVQVEVDPEPAPWPALADASQVELLLLNLAINARDAMPNGGTLAIRTRGMRTGPAVRAEDPPEGEFTVLYVSDTGHGMSPHVLARAFEPFFTTKDVGKGSGLGLPQVLGVAQQMGGGVRIESRPEEGTTISVFLPRAVDAQLGQILQGAPPRVIADFHITGVLAGARILLVDDDEDVRVVTSAIVEELGGVVTGVASGAAALLAMQTQSFDLVLADLMMPNMSGLQLATEMRALVPDLPLVLMTGYGPEVLADPGPHVRATLRKPFRADALLHTLIVSLGRDTPPAAAAAGHPPPDHPSRAHPSRAHPSPAHPAPAHPAPALKSALPRQS